MEYSTTLNLHQGAVNSFIVNVAIGLCIFIIKFPCSNCFVLLEQFGFSSPPPLKTITSSLTAVVASFASQGMLILGHRANVCFKRNENGGTEK